VLHKQFNTTFIHNLMTLLTYKENNTGLFEMIVGVLTTCHTQYTWDRSMCIFLFNRATLQVFVTYLTGALYVHPLWFYKHQHDNRVVPKLFVACQRWWFQWRFWFTPWVLGYLREEEEQEEEEHKFDPWRNPMERNRMGLHLENKVAVLKTPTIISNNSVYKSHAQSNWCIWRCSKANTFHTHAMLNITTGKILRDE